MFDLPELIVDAADPGAAWVQQLSVTDPAERSLTIVARVEVSLGQVFMGTENLADELEKCGVVSEFLLDRAPAWLED